MLSAAGEFGFVRLFEENVTAFLGGVKSTFVTPNLPITPFFQILFGVEHGFGVNEFALQPAGGITMPLSILRNGRLIGEIAFRTFPAAEFSETETRFSVGLAFPFSGLR